MMLAVKGPRLHYEIISYLVATGADKDIPNANGELVLEIAQRRNLKKVTELLCEKISQVVEKKLLRIKTNS